MYNFSSEGEDTMLNTKGGVVEKKAMVQNFLTKNAKNEVEQCAQVCLLSNHHKRRKNTRPLRTTVRGKSPHRPYDHLPPLKWHCCFQDPHQRPYPHEAKGASSTPYL
ncbi:unnamed protein product [Ixodes pacificus]